MTDCLEIRTALPSSGIPADCCTFSGLVCENGRIVELNLLGRTFSGPFPAIGKLTALRVLNIRSTLISGELPDFLWDLQSLRDVTINGNQLTGGLSERVGNLKNLFRFEVYGNKLTGPAPASIGSLSNLDTFQLRDNLFDGPIPASYGNLGKARNIGNCRFSGPIPESFGGLQAAQYISLDHNSLTGTVPDSLLRLPLLKLDVSSNRLYGDFMEKFKLVQNPNMDFNIQQNYFVGTVPETVNSKTLSLQTDPTAPIPSATSPLTPSVPTSTEVVVTIPNPTNPSGPPLTVTEVVPVSVIANITGNPLSATNLPNPSSSPSPNRLTTITVNGTPQVIPVGDTNEPSPGSSSPSVAVIASVVVVVLLLAVAAVATFVYIHRRRSQKSVQDSVVHSGGHGRSHREGWIQLQHAQTLTNYAPAANTDSKTDIPTQAASELKIIGGGQLWQFKAGTQSGSEVMSPKFVEAGLGYQPELDTASSSNTLLALAVPATPVTFVNEITKQQVPSQVTLVGEFVKHSSLVAPPRLSSTASSKPSPDAEVCPPLQANNSNATVESTVSMSDASTWTPSQVAEWLESADVSPRLAAILKEHGVTGYQLLLMTEGKLLDMGIEIQLSRRIVMEAVETLRAGNAGECGQISTPRPPQYS
ncbi:hypothetical protein HDU97_002133 [Phlyctochytrium planicorne]|nr:hypothetical protein HDU97_002133 [Phlyctochytrium planicorne]